MPVESIVINIKCSNGQRKKEEEEKQEKQIKKTREMKEKTVSVPIENWNSDSSSNVWKHIELSLTVVIKFTNKHRI